MDSQLDLFTQYSQVESELNRLHKQPKQQAKRSKLVKPVETEAHVPTQPTRTCAFCVHAKQNDHGWYDCSAWNVEALGDNGVCYKSDLFDQKQHYGNLYRINGRLVAGVKQILLAVEKGEILLVKPIDSTTAADD